MAAHIRIQQPANMSVSNELNTRHKATQCVSFTDTRLWRHLDRGLAESTLLRYLMLDIVVSKREAGQDAGAITVDFGVLEKLLLLSVKEVKFDIEYKANFAGDARVMLAFKEALIEVGLGLMGGHLEETGQAEEVMDGLGKECVVFGRKRK